MVKNPPAMRVNLGLIPGGGHGNPLQYSFLEKENHYGQRRLAGYSPRGHRVRYNWETKHSIAQSFDLKGRFLMKYKFKGQLWSSSETFKGRHYLHTLHPPHSRSPVSLRKDWEMDYFLPYQQTRMSQSSGIAAFQCELQNPQGTQEGEEYLLSDSH